MSYKKSDLYRAITERSEGTYSKVRQILTSNDGSLDLNLKDKNNAGYLHLCAELEGETEKTGEDEISLVPIVYMLSQGGMDVSSTDSKGNTALHTSVMQESGHRMVAAMFKIGIDPTVANEEGNTAGDYVPDDETHGMYVTFEMFYPGIWQTVEGGDADKLEELLDYWCRVRIEHGEETLLDRARELENVEVVKILENADSTMEFLHAGLAFDIEKMKRLLKEDDRIDVNIKDESSLNEQCQIVPMPLLAEALYYKQKDLVKALIKKGANVNLIISNPTTKDKDPLFYYLMKHTKKVESYFLKFLDHAEISMIRDAPSDVLWRAYKNNWPVEIINHLMKNGISIFGRDTDGRSLRDKIVVDAIDLPEAAQRDKLQFVDQHVFTMITNGDMDKLDALAMEGYHDLNVQNQKGKTAVHVAQKKDQTDIVKFLEGLPEFEKKVKKIHQATIAANLYEVRQFVNSKTVNARDNGGRAPLHLAVLYERRFIIKHLVKEFPESIKQKDIHGRTALHYACALSDADDIREMLMKAGADEHTKDNEGKSPKFYKVQGDNEALVKHEREKIYGVDIYLRLLYYKFRDAIESGKLENVRNLVNQMHTGVTIGDVMKLMYLNKGETKPQDLLFYSIEKRQEEIAIYLLEEGADPVISAPFGEDDINMTLRDAAEEACMLDLAELVESFEQVAEEEKREKEEQERHEIDQQEANEGPSRNSNIDDEKMDDTRKESPDDKKKSSTCTVL